MSEITLKEIQYKNFGKCVELSNGIIKVIVTVDVGPRIINYSFVNGENIFWEDINRLETTDEVVDAYGSPWYLYGGHRLWTSPEASPRTYYADNDPVEYRQLPEGATFIQKTQKINQVQCEISVTLAPDSSEVKVCHKITNKNAWDIKFAIWALSVMSQGGLEVIPQPASDTGLLNNRIIGIWPYAKMTDSRISWGDRYVTMKQNPEIAPAYELGINSEHGFAMYFNHGDLFVKKFDVVRNGTYPDGGMSFESYVCGNFLECESLGELKNVAPNETIEHCEYWILHKADCPEFTDDNTLDELKEQYVL